MACIKSAQRSALVAMAPEAPYLAAGTVAGAVDLSFSSSANLEIYKLDFRSDSPDLEIVASLPSSDRFSRLSWSKPVGESEGFGLGLVAGGLGDGSIGVWNPVTMINSEDQDAALVGKLEKHVGPVRGLEFSTVKPNMLASGADEGEICIWDLEKPSEPKLFPSLKGVASGAQTEVSYVSWNYKFEHILASTSYNGITVVWDLRQQKPLTSFSDSVRRRCSVLQWNPEFSTQLVIASDDDNSPALRVWDVRKTISPLREFVGHTKGVIAMSWCPYDSSYLLTCAKDNRTICWDTHTGEIVSELPASTNWNFDVHWYPKIPGVISASSFDMKIGIYNIEACGRYTAADGSFTAQPRLTAPKWLKCPTGASFGFGGKFVSFRPNTEDPQTNNSEVYVHELVTEQTLVTRSTEFETLIKNGEKSSLRDLCDKKSEESLSQEERETWGFLKVMFEEEDARTKLISHLGFSRPEPSATDLSTDDLTNTLAETLTLDSTTTQTLNPPAQTDSPFLVDNGDDFFNNPQPIKEPQLCSEQEITPNTQEVIKTTEEVLEGSRISSEEDKAVDESIQRALVVGNYKGAVNQCIEANRMADALVIAHVGGESLWESTRNKYLKNSSSSYLKIVSAMVGNDLMMLVNTWPLGLWKETLALLCTFAQKDEWTVLCDSLASRLLTVGNTLAATLCYICAGNIDKTVEIWSQNLKSEDGSKTYVDLLQDLMEKTITLALATGQKKFSASLSKLVESYAELLASQGLLSTAMEYLKLLGTEDSSNELTVLRERIAYSAEIENVASRSFPTEQQTGSYYVQDQSGFSSYDNYQGQQQGYNQQSYTPSSYNTGYTQQRPQYQEYTPTNPISSFQPAVPQQTNQISSFQPAVPPANMFVPSQPQHTALPPQTSFGQQTGASQPSVRSFVPSNAPVLKNAEQYQQPTTLGSQLYPGLSTPPHSISTTNPPPSSRFSPSPPQQQFTPSAPSQQQFTPNIPPQQFTPNMPPQQQFTPNMPAQQQFTPNAPAQQFKTSLTGTQPSSPTLAAMQQQTAPAVTPPAPPPTVQTADTSKVSGEMKPVIKTLTRLFEETSRALGGPQANPAKKREMEDNSKKIGALFAKLNSGDISPNAAGKLVNLCSSLDNGDFASAMHIQVLMTTSDWDECNFWLSALKRMIKTRQSLRL